MQFSFPPHLPHSVIQPSCPHPPPQNKVAILSKNSSVYIIMSLRLSYCYCCIDSFGDLRGIEVCLLYVMQPMLYRGVKSHSSDIFSSAWLFIIIVLLGIENWYVTLVYDRNYLSRPWWMIRMVFSIIFQANSLLYVHTPDRYIIVIFCVVWFFPWSPWNNTYCAIQRFLIPLDVYFKWSLSVIVVIRECNDGISATFCHKYVFFFVI